MPCDPVDPSGTVKLKIAAEVVPLLLTDADPPGAPVVVPPTLTVAADPVAPVGPWMPCAPVAPVFPWMPCAPVGPCGTVKVNATFPVPQGPTGTVKVNATFPVVPLAPT